MTSQVAVMNLRGVAVASDTVLSRSSNVGTKTMGNTGKIYEIGPGHKVLVLHSGNAEINGVPLSLHLGEWARTLTTAKPTLQSYVDSYIAWASREKGIHAPESEVSLIHLALNEHYYWMKRRVTSVIEELELDANLTEKQQHKATAEAVQKGIQSGLEFLEGQTNFPGFSDVDAAAALTKGKFDLDEKIDFIFEGLPIDEVAKALLKASAPLTLSRSQAYDDTDAVLGFIGYGEDEAFGASIKLTIRGIYGGALQATTEEQFGVSPDASKSAIKHFAQGDAIYAFIRGYNFKIIDRVRSLIRDKVEERWGSTTEEPIGQQVADEVFDEISSFAFENFAEPLLGTIEAMSMQSLGDFAESLVGLQVTATYSQDGPATVGGIIEVATIDRLNGVVWKQKLKS
jgi:hypothetical protein